MKDFELFTEEERLRQIKWMRELLPRYRNEFNWNASPLPESPDAYHFINGWFGPMDAEVYHSLIREKEPNLIVEIGSGNTTRLAWNAGKLNPSQPQIISIDPHPASKVLVEKYATKFYNSAFEETDVPEIDHLKADDIFFMDSSHNIMNADVQKEYEILWKLKAGVVIHWHDIHLPTEYQHGYRNKETGYSDQYALMALLESHHFRILCANYWLMRTAYSTVYNLCPTVRYMKDVIKEINTLCGSFWAIKL